MGNPWRRELRFLPTLRGYQRRWLARDLIAGVTFGAVTIPGQIATAHLAGMPPITGLYGFLVACLMGALIAANRNLALGVDSTVAPMLAAGIAGLGIAAGTPRYIGLALVTTFLVGVMILAIGIGNLGWVGDFLSKPVVIGFLGGIAVIIVVDQLPGLLGVPGGSGHVIPRLMTLSGRLDAINLPTLIIGICSLAVLLVGSRLSPRFPTALIVLVVATTAVTLLDLTKDGVAVLGPLKRGLPTPDWPPLSMANVDAVIGTALAITIICLAQTSATTRNSSAVGGYETSIDADFRALGAANVASSLVGSFTIDASPPSTTIISESRGRTQAASLVAAVMVVVVLFASALAENLPTATLSAVLIYIAIKIFDVDQMRATKQYSWRAFSLMLITMFGVILLGIKYGVAFAVLVAVASQARRTARPELRRLGRSPEGLWLPEADPTVQFLPGIAVFGLNGPLWFGNANWFRLELMSAIVEGPAKPGVLILDARQIAAVDFAGARARHVVARVCALRSVMFGIVTEPGRTERAFASGGVTRQLGEERFYDTIPAAVAALAHN